MTISKRGTEQYSDAHSLFFSCIFIILFPLFLNVSITLASESNSDEEFERTHEAVLGAWEIVEGNTWKELSETEATEKRHFVTGEAQTTYLLVRDISNTSLYINTLSSEPSDKGCHGTNVNPITRIKNSNSYRNRFGNIVVPVVGDDGRLTITTKHPSNGVVWERIYKKASLEEVEKLLAKGCQKNWSQDESLFGFWRVGTLTSSGNGVERKVKDTYQFVDKLYEQGLVLNTYFKQRDCYVVGSIVTSMDTKDVYVSTEIETLTFQQTGNELILSSTTHRPSYSLTYTFKNTPEDPQIKADLDKQICK